MMRTLRSGAGLPQAGLAAAAGPSALQKQQRAKGWHPSPNVKTKWGTKNHSWFNRGLDVDKKSFGAMQNKINNLRGRDRKKNSGEGHIGWGPTPHHRFTDITDMAREMERKQSNPADLSPSPVHKNKKMIVPEDFDFQATLKRRGEFQPKAKMYYDEVAYALAHNKEELKRLRGDPTDEHLKFYHGPFPLHSL